MTRFFTPMAAFLLAGAVLACQTHFTRADDAQPTTKPVPDLGIGADMHGAQVFPVDDLWNKDISKDPVDPLSDKIVQNIGPAKPLHPDLSIPYMVVGSDQKKLTVPFKMNDESDPGPYPVPMNAPIEGGGGARGDRHVLIIDRDAWILYELYQGVRGKDSWTASQGSIFNLAKMSMQRPPGWTSADAAGLPIFPGLLRYDEVAIQKKITHALRFTVQRSQKAYVPPALHYASRLTDPTRPPMGMKVRLKADYDISGFPPSAQVVLTALKKYGLICADNGGDWFITGAPDDRWDEAALQTLTKVKGSDLEVVRMDGLVTAAARAAAASKPAP